MCGICGIINLKGQPVEELKLHHMIKSMKHRGPDDEGIFVKENIGFGFVRLSILDLSSAGHQPMVSNDGRYVIVLNGEIFNYIELREELKGSYNFKSGTDTEVLLASYIKWGESCLERLNGMFAFAVLDTFTKNLFAARDRFGIKPLYYYEDNDHFIFASDIPPLLIAIKEKREPENQIVFDYLVFNRTNHEDKTFFKNIFKLQHGHYLTVKSGVRIIKKWYFLPERILQYNNTSFKAGDFLEEFSNSVNLQLRSDVPVGTCLSGGLDSSAITSMVLHNRKDVDLHSFSAVYGKGRWGDESEFISEYRDQKLKIHYTTPSDDSLIDDLNDFVNAISEPVPTTSIYAEYKVMELAKKYCTVLLNGQGADEMMAGYHYFYGYYFSDLLMKGSWGKFLNEVFQYTKTHNSLFGLKSMAFSFNPRSLRHFKNHSFIDNKFYNQYYRKENVLFDNFYKSKSLKDFLLNHFEYKFEHHLLWADKTGMKFSLETRFPFLDHNLVEKTLALSEDNYIRNGYTKAIMRDALIGIVPEKIRMRRDKIGFLTPEHDWFKKSKIQAVLSEIIESESFANRGYFNIISCKNDLLALKKYNKYSPEFWKMIHLELWFRQYIDKNPI